MKNDKKHVFGIASMLIYTSAPILYFLFASYFYRYGTFPKDKLIMLFIIALGFFFYILSRSLLLVVSDTVMSFNRPIFFMEKLQIKISDIHSIKYARRPGRWAVPEIEINFRENGEPKYKILKSYLYAFEIKRLQKLVGNKLQVVITDW